MKPETFFKRFDDLADVPNAVGKLRELVLQLAAHGKLLGQSSDDEPASALVSRIEKHIEGLRSQKEFRGSPVERLNRDELPEIPSSWEWVRLGNVVDYGSSDKAESDDIPEDAWLLDLEDIEKDTSRLVQRKSFRDSPSKSTKTAFAVGDVLYGKLRPYLNKVIVADAPGYCTTEIIPIRAFGFIDPAYLCHALKRPEFIAYANSKSYGMNLPRLGTEDARSAPFPLPPLAEQKRIVAKVDALMELCDQLEAQQQERETRHAALTRASLARFAGAPTPTNLEFLFHPSYVIPPADLRKSIIDAASRGALSPAVITGKPVREELASRRAERRQSWIKLKDRIAGYEEPERVRYDEFPKVPKHWGLEYLGLLGEDRFYAVQTGPFGSQLLKTEFVQSGVPVVAVGNLTGLGFSSNGLYQITKEKAVQLSRYDVQAGDLLFARTGATLGKVCLAPNEAKDWRMTGHILRVRLDKNIVDPRLVVLFLWASDFVKSQVSSGIRGMTRPGFNTGLLERILIPIPPLAEQRRIVAKVEQLTALVDALGQRLAASRATGAKLLSALVAELTGAPSNNKVSTPSGSGTGRRGRPRKS